MNHIMKRSVSFVLALLMVLSLAPQLSLRADAAELGGLSDSSIGLDYTEAGNSGVVDWSASGAQIIGSAKGAIHTTAGYYRKETSTLTITNNKASAAKLSFNYVVTTATANDSVTIDGTAYTGSGSVSVELAAKGSLVIVLTAGQANEQNNAAITITNLALVADRDATTTFQAAENGSYTVTDAEGNEVEITADTQLVQHSSKAYTLKATADEGYMFFGWYNATTGSYISYTAETVYQSDADQTIVPVFTSTSTAVFEVSGVKFMDLGAAADYAVANSKNQIVLISSGTISGDYTIPAGVTLLIPFDEAYTCYTTEPSNTTDPDKTGDSFSAAVGWVQPYAYKTLTMAAGSSITVNGAISVSGQHTAGNSANGVCSYVGCPTGPVGFIDMAEGSEIVINNGGAAYVWGYIIGDGEITAKSGATVYENMQFTDFRGGSATLGLADPEGLGGELGIFPLSQYYVQNVEVKMTLEAGANEYVYTSLFMSNLALSSGVKFMGEGAMFVAEDGGHITKEYIPETDRLEICVYGNAQINSLSLELAGTKVDSSDYTLPINSNITINIYSGRTVVNQNMALLPGSAVTIADGAELNIAENWNIYIYDATEWDSYTSVNMETGEMTTATGGDFVNQGRKFIAVPHSPTRTYTRTEADLVDVTLDVNGTLSGNGYLYTTESGANVTNSKGTGIVYMIAGLSAAYVESTQTYDFGWFTCQAIQNGADIIPAYIPSTSIKLHNADGSYTGTEDAAAGDAYGWDLAAGKWVKITDATLTFDANGGSGEMAAVTVTKDAIISGDNGITLAANAFTKTGHIFKGWALSADGEVYYADSAAIKVSTGLTLYAVWEPETYDVEFCSEDWSGTMVATYGEKFEIPGAAEFDPAPSKEGYSLVGWTTVENGTEVEYVPGDLIDVTADMTLYAVWQINKYTVTWVDESGNTVATEEVEHGSDAANVPAVPGKEGHAGAWEQEAKNVTSDLTIRPVYTVNSYTITWKNADGAVLDTDEVEFGKTPVYTGATPTKAATAMYSYTFAGWTPDVAAVTGDATYTATYTETVNEYTITWIVDGVETVDTYTFGQTVEIPENPEKVGHTFAGWGAEIPAAMPAEDLTFTAQWTVNTYTITWKNADGTVLDTDEVEYGKTPVYTGNVPTKAADAQYTYFFAGWDPVVVAVTGDATYTAVYTTEVQTYTVTWVNADGTVLETDYDVPCGETPSYDGAAPTKAADAQYTYTFAGWTPEVSMVTGDVTYTAVYTQTVNTYTVTWKNADGTVLETDENVPYGETPSYDGAAPTKEGNAQYSYTFAGWTPAVAAVSGNATYTAVYTETVNTYTITWVDADGTVLENDENVPYGETPSYDGAAPTKEGNAQYTYTFAGWTPAVAAVTGDATYTAVYTETVNTYTITWVDADGTVLENDENVPYGETPSYDGAAPTKEGNAQYTYTFAGWTPAVAAVTGDATYTAVYTEKVNTYTVTWVDADGTVLETDENVPYGETPSYDGAVPAKEGNAQYSYTFAGWTPAVAVVTGDATYTAVYTEKVNTYTITWKNADGTVLETDENVPYGETPSYDGKTPTKAATAQHTYTFAGWTPEVDEVTGDAIYTAVYTETVNIYTITWKNADGTVLATDKVEYGKTPVYTGATPTKAATAQYTYTFADWDREILPVTGDATYNATYTATVNKYTVKFVNEDGTVLQESQVAYGEIPAYTGAEPEKEGNAQYSYTFAGWDQEVVAVTGDATYTAWYTQTVNTYTVIWADEDGTVLETDENVPYGQMPEFDGDIPVKAETNRYSYTFAGWDKAVVEVTGDVTYSAVYKATDKMTVKWVSITTTLSGDIGLNFYAQVSDTVLNDPTAFVRFVFDGKTRDIPVSEAVESTRNGTVCYRFTCLITSKNMTDSVTAQFMNAEGTIGEPKTMDVATYCNWIIANYSDQKTVGLMKAMLNYGASAQMLFGHNTDNLANAALSEEDKVLPNVDASKYAHVNEGSEDGIKVSSMTLLLDSETTVRVYFTLTGDKTIDEYTFIVDGQEVVPTEKSGRYFVEIRNIAAHRLNQWHTVTCGGITVKYAALSYVNQVMNYAAATPETVEMAKALFAYFEAAAAYLA